LKLKKTLRIILARSDLDRTRLATWKTCIEAYVTLKKKGQSLEVIVESLNRIQCYPNDKILHKKIIEQVFSENNPPKPQNIINYFYAFRFFNAVNKDSELFGLMKIYITEEIGWHLSIGPHAYVDPAKLLMAKRIILNRFIPADLINSWKEKSTINGDVENKSFTKKTFRDIHLSLLACDVANNIKSFYNIDKEAKRSLYKSIIEEVILLVEFPFKEPLLREFFTIIKSTPEAITNKPFEELMRLPPKNIESLNNEAQ